MTVTVDVPPGTPVEQIQIPGLARAGARHRRPGPSPTPTPVPTRPPAPDAAGVETPDPSRPTPGNQPAAATLVGGGGDAPAAEARTPAAPRRAQTAATQSPATAPTGNVRSGAGRVKDKRARAPPAAGTPDGSPTPANPDLTRSPRPGAGADRRAELLHRQLPDPAVPAADLPGRRHPVRRPLGGPRRDQRDRDRLRPQPQRELRGRPRLDAVHAVDVEDVRRRRATGTASRTRTTRSTRSSPPRATCGRPAPTRDIRRAVFAYNHADWYVDSVLLRAQVIGGLPVEPRRLAHRADPGPLPGPREGDATRATISRRRPQRVREAQRRACSSSPTRPPRHPHLLAPGAPVVAVNDGRIVEGRRARAPRPLRRAPGRLRQHATRTGTSARSPSATRRRSRRT